MHPGRGITFNVNKAGGPRMSVPCGGCIGCRLDRSRDWATRIHHEAQMHDDNAFLTLTFDDHHLPADYSVRVRDVQLFMKRLRKKVGKVRFFACGEYGDQGGRPHYHIIVFGHAFPDRTPWAERRGFVTYRSAVLEELWPFGLSEIGSVTHQSAGYVARYVLKKVSGAMADGHYQRIHPHTGEVVQVRPEFICMSNRPGIGGAWYDQFSGDVFPSDFLIIEGKKVPVPRYYTKKIEGSQLKEEVTEKRLAHAADQAEHSTPERLEVRHELQLLRVQKLQRDLE